MRSAIHLILLVCMLLISNSLSGQAINFVVEKLDSDQLGFSAAARITNHNIEETIVANPAAVVVDRETFVDVETERERQKSESFIDGQYVEQGKALGADFMIFPSYTSASRLLILRVVDVAKSAVVINKEYPLSHFVDKDGKLDRPDYYARYVNEITEGLLQDFTAFHMTIKLVGIEKVDKEKAKEALIYCPNDCTLKPKTEIDLFHRRAIKNTELFKYDQIGSAKIKNDESNGLYLISVKKGGEVLLKLNNEEQEVYAKIKS